MGRVMTQLKHAWDAWQNPNLTPDKYESYGSSYGGGYRPDRTVLTITNEQTLLAAIYVRMSIDAASVGFRHIRRDEQDRYVEDIKSKLYNCLTVEANVDQGSRDFFQDVFLSMFDKGYIAICPTKATKNPNVTDGWDVLDMRIGEVVNFYARHVRVRVYNENKGQREEIVLSKNLVAVVYNPFYAVMNSPNSTLQRLRKKLAQLDTIDDHNASGNLDLIIQLPYVIKNDSLAIKAKERRQEIEMQLKDSQFGIAYTDGTEKITQLNRPAENNIFKQVEMLVKMLHAQLGITEEVMNGTADEATMINYYNRAIEPCLAAVAQAMHRTFLTQTGRTQGQAVDFFRNPFKLVPIKDLAELADKFTRNEILSSNEFRAILGMRPDSDPKSDQLRNSNMPESELGGNQAPAADGAPAGDGLDEIGAAIDEIFADLEVPE